MTRPKYVASCSGGKDSVATLLLAAQHNEPLDEAVFSEVMFDKDTSGEVPEHRDFIYDRLKPFCEKELGIKFTILHADKTYDEVFHHVITRGPHKGEVRGFAWAGMCAVNRDCKIPPVRKYNAALSPDTVSYVGIAEDEPKRLAASGRREEGQSACQVRHDRGGRLQALSGTRAAFPNLRSLPKKRLLVLSQRQ
jgi:3'-phosphoadenosine 5'-phosphosulfate sulfotransferase (PAPS reductase)/FAD synthetase